MQLSAPFEMALRFLFEEEEPRDDFLFSFQDREEVIRRDKVTAKRYGVTLYQIGCILERMVYKMLQREFVVDGTYRILSGPSIVKSCPFSKAHEVKYGRYGLCIEKIETKERFNFESIMAHLVKDHSFCGGPGTAYRVDVEQAISFFGIQPHISYQRSTEPRPCWKPVFVISRSDRICNFLALRSIALEEFRHSNFLALVVPTWVPPNILFPAGCNVSREISSYIYQMKIQERDRDIAAGLTAPTIEEIHHQMYELMRSIRDRVENYKSERLMYGLHLVVFGIKDFNFSTVGMDVTRTESDSIQFYIHSIYFDSVILSRSFPYMLVFSLESQNYTF